MGPASGLMNISSFPETFRLALCAFNLGMGGRSREAFLAGVSQRLARSHAQGAELLVLPEYLSEAFLAWKPRGLKPTEELAFMAAEAEALMPEMAALVAEHGVSLVAGSVPWADGKGGFVNRAIAMLADNLGFDHMRV